VKLTIITEGGLIGGLGHIQRCLAMSQAFEEAGIRSEFIVHGDNSIKEVLKERKYRIVNWLKERDKVLASISKSQIVIVDSYLGDIGFYEKLSLRAGVPVYIDDNKRLDYPQGIVVNSGIHARSLKYPSRDHVTYLLGRRYALLRKPFWETGTKKIGDEVKSIMVTTGGCDPANVIPKIMGCLRDKYPLIKKNIIIGNSFGNIDAIKRQADKVTKLIYFPDAAGMKKQMTRSDIAISAGGQTLYEFARMGVPTIAFCQSENQRLGLEAWRNEGFIEYAGGINNLEGRILRVFDRFRSQKERYRRSRKGMELVDGQGARRTREVLLAYEN